MTPDGAPPPGAQALNEMLLAHHVALLAIPAIVPAVIVVGVILYIARQDRRDEREEHEREQEERFIIDRAFQKEDE